MDPTSTIAGVVSNVAGAVSSAISVTKFVNDIKNTNKDVEACFKLTQRVKADLSFLETLRQRYYKDLCHEPSTLQRLDQIIREAKESIFDVESLLEGCRPEPHGSKIPASNKFKWVLSDSAAFVRRTGNLQQQHAAVNVEIQQLRALEILKPLKRIETTTFENPGLLFRSQRKVSERRLGEDAVVGKSGDKREAGSVVDSAPISRAESRASSSTASVKNYSVMSDQDVAVETSQVEEDPEEEFYRDLRRREYQRQKRLAARNSHMV